MSPAVPLTSRLLTLLLLLTFVSPARAATDAGEIILSQFNTRLQAYEDENGEDEHSRQALVEMFEDINDRFASARRFKALGAYMKKAVARKISDDNQTLALYYKATVNDLKNAKATKAQLKELASRYSASKSRVKAAQRVFNDYVDRVTRDYIRKL